MIKCRAITIRGERITFEHHDRGIIRMPFELGGDRLLTEMIGEGFHVVSEVPYHVGPKTRTDLDEAALRASGVDPKTAQWWDIAGGLGYLGAWRWLFSMNESAEFAPGAIHWRESMVPTSDMVVAGAAALHDAVIELASLHRGRLAFLGGYAEPVKRIWAAMEKAK